MLDWFIDKFFALLKSFPALFTEEGSPNYFLSRAMLGLGLLVLILCLFSARPVRAAIAGAYSKICGVFLRKPSNLP